MRGGGAFNTVLSMSSDSWFGVGNQDYWASGHYGFRIAAKSQAIGGNQAPVVEAGTDFDFIPTALPDSKLLAGIVTDDGLPIPSAVTISWVKSSGPGTVTFANANSQSTMATFSEYGTYVLRVTANDGELSTSDEVLVKVLIGFQSTIMPIFSSQAGSSCTGCHTAPATSFGNLNLNQSAALVWQELRVEAPIGEPAQFVTRAIPGDPANSLILLKPQGLQSHGGGPRSLSSTQLDALTLWINQGAQNN